jgi:hypothetical protein
MAPGSAHECSRKIQGTLKSTQDDLERNHEIGFRDQSRVRRSTRRPQQDHRRQEDGTCGCQPSTRRHSSSSSIESDGSAFSSLDRRAASFRTSSGTEIGCCELAMSSHNSVTTRSLSETGSARREEISMLMVGISGEVSNVSDSIVEPRVDKWRNTRNGYSPETAVMHQVDIAEFAIPIPLATPQAEWSTCRLWSPTGLES